MTAARTLTDEDIRAIARALREEMRRPKERRRKRYEDRAPSAAALEHQMTRERRAGRVR